MPRLATFGTAAARAFGFGAGAADFSTWNPLDKAAAITLSNGDNTATANSGAGFANVRGTLGHNSGKWAFEITVVTVSGVGPSEPLGAIADATFSLTGNPGTDTHCIEYDRLGAVFFNNVNLGAADVYTAGSVLHYEVDIPNSNLWVQLLGGTGRKGPFSMLGIGATVYPMGGVRGLGDAVTLNTGGAPFSIAPTSGFSPWG